MNWSGLIFTGTIVGNIKDNRLVGSRLVVPAEDVTSLIVKDTGEVVVSNSGTRSLTVKDFKVNYIHTKPAEPLVFGEHVMNAINSLMVGSLPDKETKGDVGNEHGAVDKGEN